MNRRGTGIRGAARSATLLPALALTVFVLGAYGLTRAQAGKPAARVYAQTERWALAIQAGDAEAALAFHQPGDASGEVRASAETRASIEGLAADYEGGPFSIVRVERGEDPGGPGWLATVQFGHGASVVVPWSLDSGGIAWIR